MRKQPALLDDNFPLPLNAPFTLKQALDSGLSRHRLRQLERSALIRRLLRGVYVAAQVRDSQKLRASALRLVVPDGYVVTDESAGWLAGAPMILRPGAHLEVPPVSAFALTRHRRLRNDLSRSGARTLAEYDVHEIDGITVTTPLRTALDLGRLRHRDRAIGALDQLLRLGSFGHEELLEQVERFRRFRGVRQLRVLSPLADARSESPGESVLRLRFQDAGLPRPTPQYEIRDRDGRLLGRGDLVLEELRFLAEYDGERWHGPEARAHDDRRRRAIEEAGWSILVVRRSDVFGRQQNAIELLNGGVRRARRRLARDTPDRWIA